MNIYGEKVMLRAMEPEDMELLREAMNDPEMEQMVGGWSLPISRAGQHKWYENNFDNKSTIRLIIVELETEMAVGLIYLTNIDWKNRNASRGIKLFRTETRGKGIARDASFTLMKYAFEELNLHRLNSEILSYNHASIKYYERCGGVREGVKRQAVFKNGEYHDVYCYGVLYQDFLEAKKCLNWNPAK